MQDLYCLLTRFAIFVIIFLSLIKTIAKLQNILLLITQNYNLNQKYTMPSLTTPLRLNVGFIIHAEIGFNRSFDIELDKINLDASLEAKDISGQIEFSRTQSGLLVEATLNAQTNLECSKCLDNIIQPLNINFTELYAFNEKNMTDSELLIPEDGFIDLTPLIQDFLQLAMPINPTCKDNCAGLCPICGINHNHHTCDCEPQSIDPRLASLKDLLDKKE